MLNQTEIAIKKIKENSNVSDSDIIEDLILEHETSDRYELMSQGEQYYDNENDILDRKKYYYEDGEKKVDETAANNKVPHNWHKLLVDQKASYVAGKPPVIQAENDDFTEKINELLGERFDDDIPEIVVEASNKGKDWLHPYIDPEGEFQYIEVDPRQIVPVYDTEKQKELTDVLRYYQVVVNGEERIRVEWWTAEDVTYYIENKEGIFESDTIMEDEPKQPHFWKDGEGWSWGKVPFVEFPNNRKEFPDLKQYKEMIDLYDKTISDFGNDLEEIQEAIWILINYGGESLKEFRKNLRYYKAMKTDEEGDARKETIEIPTEAKEKFLDRLEENIFLFGQGANMKTDRFGNSPSGVSLQFLYSMLDMKANILIRKFKGSIKNLCWFIARYAELDEGADYNPDQVTITFNKTMIFNESEKIENVQNSMGVTSNKTALANHPYVDDVEKEIQQIKKERDDIINLDNYRNDGENNDEE